MNPSKRGNTFVMKILIIKYHSAMKKVLTTLLLFLTLFTTQAQTIFWEGREFEISNVTTSLIEWDGEEVLKIEKDLKGLHIDEKNIAAVADMPNYVKVKNLNIKNGSFEVKVLSRIQVPKPFSGAQGFIGVAFRIDSDNTSFESIYLRPNVGRSENQIARNHTVQYFAYPDFKFDITRKPEYNGQYETYADVGLDEWITIRVEFKDKVAKLYLNDQEYPSFIVNETKGNAESGSLGLWVDIGTEGYFKDFKIKQME